MTCLDELQISLFDLGYLKAAAEDDAHEVVLQTFLTESKLDPRITRAFIAKRTHKKPEQITRLLSSSGNWTLDTYGLLLGAMGYRATFGAEKISIMRWANECHLLVTHNQDMSGNRSLRIYTVESHTETDSFVVPSSMGSVTFSIVSTQDLEAMESAE